MEDQSIFRVVPVHNFLEDRFERVLLNPVGSDPVHDFELLHEAENLSGRSPIFRHFEQHAPSKELQQFNLAKMAAERVDALVQCHLSIHLLL